LEESKTTKHTKNSEDQSKPLTLADSSLKVSVEVKETMARIQAEATRDWKIFQKIITPTQDITSLYTVFPDISRFTSLHSRSELQSYVAHFVKKIEIFQRFAKLPFGDEALKSLQKAL